MAKLSDPNFSLDNLTLDELRSTFYLKQENKKLLVILSSYMNEETSMDQRTIELFNFIAQLILTDEYKSDIFAQTLLLSEQLKNLSELCMDLSTHYLITHAESTRRKSMRSDEQ